VATGVIVVCHHDRAIIVVVLMHFIVFGEADMFVPVVLFDCLIECRAQTVDGDAILFGQS